MLDEALLLLLVCGRRNLYRIPKTFCCILYQCRNNFPIPKLASFWFQHPS